MRQVLIDELRPGDVARLDNFLKEHASCSSLEGLYWVELSRDLLDADQFANEADQPFCFAVEVGDSWAKFELLVRSRPNMKSPHVRYASRVQRTFILDFCERLIGELGLKT